MIQARHRLILAAAILLVVPTTGVSQVRWQDDFRAGLEQARQERKLLLVHFYSDDCPHCERLEQGPLANADVLSAIERDFVPVRVHAKKQSRLTEHFQVTAWPTDVIVDIDGRIYRQGISPQETKQYSAMLVAAASAAGRFGEPQRLAAESTSSLAANPAVPAGLEPPLVGSSLYAPNASTDFQLPPSSIPTYPASHPPQFPNTPSTTTDFQAANRPIEPSAMEGMSAATTTAAPEPLAESTGAGRTLPPLALDGHCPVTLLQQEVWEPGDSRYGALHMGSLYLFTSLEAQQTFLDDPYRYAPVLAGIDVVKLIDEQRVIPGQRQFGRFYPDPGERRVFLFADEASAARFGSDPDRYVRLADAIMKHALRTADAGGGSFAGQAVQ